jgi:hypothetical protein
LSIEILDFQKEDETLNKTRASLRDSNKDKIISLIGNFLK